MRRRSRAMEEDVEPEKKKQSHRSMKEI